MIPDKMYSKTVEENGVLKRQLQEAHVALGVAHQLNERYRQALREFALPPYHDSNLSSFVEWVNARAIAVLAAEIPKESP
jgi:hypothetical protein